MIARGRWSDHKKTITHQKLLQAVERPLQLATENGEGTVQQVDNQEETVRLSDKDEAEQRSTHNQSTQTPQEKMYDLYVKARERTLHALRSNRDRFAGPVRDRLAHETDPYIEDIKRARIIKPLSADEYMAQKHDAAAIRYAHVLCSMGEARRILEDASPKVSLLIYPEEGDDAGDDRVEELLVYLSTKDKIDVHRWDKVVDENDREAEWRQPDSLDAREAVDLFRDPAKGPVNFLNLANTEDNEVPACIANIRAYSILREISEDNFIGKRAKSNWTDLSSCRAFTLLGKGGAFSQTHWDRAGVLTASRNRGGLKNWLTWPSLTEDELLEWDVNQTPSPAADPFIVFVLPGYLYVGPRLTLHSPFTETSCRMSGTMYWDSREMAGILRAALLDFKRPNNTNEPPAKEWISKIRQIDRHWRNKVTSWPWGDDQEFEKWSRYLQVCTVPSTYEHLLIDISTGIRDSCSQAKTEASQGNACEIAQNSFRYYNL